MRCVQLYNAAVESGTIVVFLESRKKLAIKIQSAMAFQLTSKLIFGREDVTIWIRQPNTKLYGFQCNLCISLNIITRVVGDLLFVP